MRPTALWFLCLHFCMHGLASADVTPTWEYPLKLKPLGIKIPKLDDPEVDRKIHKALYYKLPQVYQQYTLGERSIKLVDDQPALNGNRNFPWAGTFGMTGDAGVLAGTGSVNFVWFEKPICVLSGGWPLTWIFPEGAMVGELLFFEEKLADGKLLRTNFELRVREKIKDANGDYTWEPTIFRPVPDADTFRRLANLPDDYEFGSRHVFLRNFQQDEVEKIEGSVEELPMIPRDTVMALLDRTFTASQWAASGGPFPRRYALGLLDVDAETCKRCHRQTGIHNYRLIPHEPRIENNFTTIRGSDGVFTWHPFRKGVFDKPSDWRLREHDHEKGVVQAAKEPGPYRLTGYVRASLADHEINEKAR
jgi:hypothetical protein